MNPPTGNHSEFPREYWFTRRLHRPWEQGWGLYHSYGVSLKGQETRGAQGMRWEMGHFKNDKKREKSCEVAALLEAEFSEEEMLCCQLMPRAQSCVNRLL